MEPGLSLNLKLISFLVKSEKSLEENCFQCYEKEICAESAGGLIGENLIFLIRFDDLVLPGPDYSRSGRSCGRAEQGKLLLTDGV